MSAEATRPLPSTADPNRLVSLVRSSTWRAPEGTEHRFIVSPSLRGRNDIGTAKTDSSLARAKFRCGVTTSLSKPPFDRSALRPKADALTRTTRSQSLAEGQSGGRLRAARGVTPQRGAASPGSSEMKDPLRIEVARVCREISACRCGREGQPAPDSQVSDVTEFFSSEIAV
jgi:hypothetical protein